MFNGDFFKKFSVGKPDEKFQYVLKGHILS